MKFQKIIRCQKIIRFNNVKKLFKYERFKYVKNFVYKIPKVRIKIAENIREKIAIKKYLF